MNYEQDYSHSHCWQEKTPPCGLPGKHRCCLCKKPVPTPSIGEQINNSDAKKWLDLTYNQMQDNLAHKLNPLPTMNWIDEKTTVAKIHDLVVLGYGWGGGGSVCDLSDRRLEREVNEILVDIKSAITEAHTKGYEEGRLAEVEDNAVSDIQVAKDKAEQLKTQGTQEALAKVEKWVNQNRECIDTEGVDEEVIDLNALLHYMQQLKDNKTL